MNSAEQSPFDSKAEDESRTNNTNRTLIIRTESLLKGRRKVWLEHSDQMYRLRVTACGKLYLTKQREWRDA